MSRRLALIAAAVAGLLLVAAAHAAGPNPPTLLSTAPGDATSFVARPIAMSFYHYKDGGGFDYIGGTHSTKRDAFDAKDRIHWSRWGETASAAVAYYIVGATGYTDRVPATVRASRVRNDRFTRLAIAIRGIAMDYLLEPTRVKANGMPHGLAAFEWCQQGPLQREHRCFEP